MRGEKLDQSRRDETIADVGEMVSHAVDELAVNRHRADLQRVVG
jgi:hypothetical protein